MNFRSTVFSLALIFGLVLFYATTPAFAKFNKRAAEKAAQRLRDNKFLKAKGRKGERNRAILEQARATLASSYPDCIPSVCFALDGSYKLNNNEFGLQKDFVELCAATLSGYSGAQFAAAQYHSNINSASTICNMVSAATNGNTFLNKVDTTVQIGSTIAYVQAGLNFCIGEFNGKPSQFQKIVVLGDVQTNRGNDNSINIANSFRSQGPGNGVCAAIIGHGNSDGEDYFLELVGGVNRLVRRPARWEDLIEEIGNIFEGICQPQV